VTTGGNHDSNALSILGEIPRVTGPSIAIATLDAGYGIEDHKRRLINAQKSSG
jgi:hypothetical protein